MVGNHDEREDFLAIAEQGKPQGRGPSRAVMSRSSNTSVRTGSYSIRSIRRTNRPVQSALHNARGWRRNSTRARASRPLCACITRRWSARRADGESGLKDTKALLNVIVPRRHVKALIFGHTHAWKLSMLGDLHLVNLPAVGYPSKSGAPTGWVACSLLEDGMRLVLRSRDSGHKDHLRPIETDMAERVKKTTSPFGGIRIITETMFRSIVCIIALMSPASLFAAKPGKSAKS
jgi:hypothetical protein